jgi:hypothetical protein
MECTDMTEEDMPVSDESPTDVKPETHDEASRRRKAELDVLFATHRANVDDAHRDYPTRPTAQFADMDDAEAARWNQRRLVIDSANRAYNRAVKVAVAHHLAEKETI